MADIDVERKETSIWPWIIGLLVLLLLAWLLFSLLDDDDVDVATAPVVEEPAITPTTTPEPIAAGPLCVGEVITDPATFVGETLDDCNVTVVAVPSDRGFFVEENGSRMLVIINDQPAEQPKDINPGQTLRLSRATLYDNVENLPGELEMETRNLAQAEDYFLNVDEENIAIVEGGTPQPGTDPAATVGEGTM